MGGGKLGAGSTRALGASRRENGGVAECEIGQEHSKDGNPDGAGVRCAEVHSCDDQLCDLCGRKRQELERGGDVLANARSRARMAISRPSYF